MCTRIFGQGSSRGNKQFALSYLVSVLLVGIFLGGISQENPLGDLVHVNSLCERQSLLYHVCLICLVTFFFFFFVLFCFFTFFLF